MRCLAKYLSLVSDTQLPKVLGHFIIKIVSKSKVILFGGATGDTGKYIITGDTYALDLISYKWTKLEGIFEFGNFSRVRNCTFS